MHNVSTYNSHLQAKLRTVITITGWCAFWIPHGLQCYCCSFFYNVIYIAMLLQVGLSVWRVQNYLCPSFFCFCSSPLEWSGGEVFFRPLVLLYVSALCFMGRMCLVFSFVGWLPASWVQWWVRLGFYPSVAYPSCGGEWQ